jgi:hypothetical protein
MDSMSTTDTTEIWLTAEDVWWAPESSADALRAGVRGRTLADLVSCRTFRNSLRDRSHHGVT